MLRKIHTKSLTKWNALWWKLFPITLGDKVRIIASKEEGTIGGMTVPASHSGKEEIDLEFFRKAHYVVLIEDKNSELGFYARVLKRWEIVKIEEES